MATFIENIVIGHPIVDAMSHLISDGTIEDIQEETKKTFYIYNQWHMILQKNHIFLYVMAEQMRQ